MWKSSRLEPLLGVRLTTMLAKHYQAVVILMLVMGFSTGTATSIGSETDANKVGQLPSGIVDFPWSDPPVAGSGCEAMSRCVSKCTAACTPTSFLQSELLTSLGD